MGMISTLPDAETVVASDRLVVLQGYTTPGTGVDRKMTLQQLLDAVAASVIPLDASAFDVTASNSGGATHTLGDWFAHFNNVSGVLTYGDTEIYGGSPLAVYADGHIGLGTSGSPNVKLFVGASDGDNVATFCQLNGQNAGQSAISFMDAFGHERGAMGYGNLRNLGPGAADNFTRHMFVEIGDIVGGGDTNGTSFAIVNTHVASSGVLPESQFYMFEAREDGTMRFNILDTGTYGTYSVPALQIAADGQISMYSSAVISGAGLYLASTFLIDPDNFAGVPSNVLTIQRETGVNDAIRYTKHNVGAVFMGVASVGIFGTDAMDLILATGITSSGTGAGDPSTGTERFRINHSTGDVTLATGTGKLGIATSGPISTLNVGGTTGVTWGASANSLGLATIGTGGTSGGSLWINTASLSTAFHSGLGVTGSYGSPSLRSVVNINAYGVNSSGGYGSDLAFSVTQNTTLSEAMRIISGGNVGIGVTTPAKKFTVQASASDYLARIYNTGANNGLEIINGGTGSTQTLLSVRSNAGGNQVLSAFADGSVVAGKQSAGATGDTGNHLLIPFCAGAPTGVPSLASEGIALRYDTTNHKLWAYDNGASAWKGVALS